MSYPEQYITEQADAMLNGRGRRLDDTAERPRPFEHYMRQVRRGEQLYMMLTGGGIPPRIVVWVGNESEFNAFYQQYYKGRFTQIALYAMPNNWSAARHVLP